MDRVPVAAAGYHRRHLDPLPESARVAREMVVELLAEAAQSDLEDTAALLVSELVTNAIVHAGTAIELDVFLDDDGIRVSVKDWSEAVPTQRHYGRSSTTGRGLAMVELLADGHGTVLEPDGGKTVWFELGSPAAADASTSSPAAGQPGRSADGHRGMPVVLQHLPVSLALAWQQHADALLREYTLARWDDDRTFEAPVDDREAHEAFATLAAAFEPLAADVETPLYTDLAIEVQAGAVEQFRALDAVLDHVTDLAVRGLTLAPPTQPEIRSFRRWLIQQVVGQWHGEQTAPWPGVVSNSESTSGPAVEWDDAATTGAIEAVVAADDLNRIIAASPAAMDLLGWGDDLLGQRIVSVIPLRYREAHIAAFTLNQLTGEKRIIGQEVRVPALRRDGTEVEVHLLVERQVAGDGRTVYTATLRPA